MIALVTIALLVICLLAGSWAVISRCQILGYEASQLQRSLVLYVLDHHGSFPASFQELIEGDYLREGRHRASKCYFGAASRPKELVTAFPTMPLLSLDKFTVLWGGHLDEFIERGGSLYLKADPTHEVFFVRPSSLHPAALLFSLDKTNLRWRTVYAYRALREALGRDSGGRQRAQ